jgi:hypothetical protein
MPFASSGTANKKEAKPPAALRSNFGRSPNDVLMYLTHHLQARIVESLCSAVIQTATVNRCLLNQLIMGTT